MIKKGKQPQSQPKKIPWDKYAYCQVGFLGDLSSNISQASINQRGRWGRTCLICATLANQYHVVDYLLRSGADRTIRCDYGWTAMDWAVRLGHMILVKLLNRGDIVSTDYPFPKCKPQNIFDAAETDDSESVLKFIGQKPNSVNTLGVFHRTPLHWAAIVGSERCWDVLVKNGANPFASDDFTLIPIDYIKYNTQNRLYKSIMSGPPPLYDLPHGSNKFDVVIIGAGAAGIAAARFFQFHSHKRYVVLEARDRIGGRVYSEKIGDTEQDFGASWIHNYGDSNPFKKLVEIYNWPDVHYDVHATQWFDLSGKYSAELHKHVSKMLNQMIKKGRAIKGISVWESIKNQYAVNVPPGSDLQRYMNYCKFQIEHYEASPLQDLDTGYDVYDQLHGYNVCPFPSYFKLLQKLAQGIQIRTQKVVSKIDYSQGIKIFLENGEVYEAQKCITTLPLGILKSHKVQFFPQLPKPFLNAIDNLGYGLMNKVFLHYDKKFWKGQIKIISQINGEMPWMVDRSTQNSFVLMCFITADYAKSLTERSDAQIMAKADRILQKVYGKSKTGKLIGGKVTKWELDPFSMGSYSHFGPGSSIKECDILKQPINNRLYFAGEHTYGKHIGTVYGAYITGEQAAQSIILSHLKK